MYSGNVRWFSDERGFGFIRTPHGNIFVRRSDVNDKQDLVKGEAVRFEVATKDDGRLKAVRVRRDSETETTQ